MKWVPLDLPTGAAWQRQPRVSTQANGMHVPGAIADAVIECGSVEILAFLDGGMDAAWATVAKPCSGGELCNCGTEAGGAHRAGGLAAAGRGGENTAAVEL